MNLSPLSAAERGELAKRHLDNVELWLRRLVDQQFEKKYGKEYLTNGPVKTDIKKWVLSELAKPDKLYVRQIDTTSFEQLKSIVCHSEFWKDQFVGALQKAFPLGHQEAAVFIHRLLNIRNDIGHLRTCSDRQLEQAICYSNDIIESIKEHYVSVNSDRIFNVPMFVKYADSLGNESNLTDLTTNISSRIIDWRTKGKGDLKPGDHLVIEMEVDPTFPPDQYDVRWFPFGCFGGTGSRADIKITNEFVGEQFEVIFECRSKKDWHRQHGLDDGFRAIFRVIPPI